MFALPYVLAQEANDDTDYGFWAMTWYCARVLLIIAALIYIVKNLVPYARSRRRRDY